MKKLLFIQLALISSMCFGSSRYQTDYLTSRSSATIGSQSNVSSLTSASYSIKYSTVDIDSVFFEDAAYGYPFRTGCSFGNVAIIEISPYKIIEGNQVFSSTVFQDFLEAPEIDCSGLYFGSTVTWSSVSGVDGYRIAIAQGYIGLKDYYGYIDTTRTSYYVGFTTETTLGGETGVADTTRSAIFNPSAPVTSSTTVLSVIGSASIERDLTVSTITASGPITATTYYGDGSNLTGISGGPGGGGDYLGSHVATKTITGNYGYTGSTMVIQSTVSVGGPFKSTGTAVFTSSVSINGLTQGPSGYFAITYSTTGLKSGWISGSSETLTGLLQGTSGYFSNVKSTSGINTGYVDSTSTGSFNGITTTYPSNYDTLVLKGVGSGGYGYSNVLAIRDQTSGDLVGGFDMAPWSSESYGIFNFYGDGSDLGGYSRLMELNVNDRTLVGDKRVASLLYERRDDLESQKANWYFLKHSEYPLSMSYQNRVGINADGSNWSFQGDLHVKGKNTFTATGLSAPGAISPYEDTTYSSTYNSGDLIEYQSYAYITYANGTTVYSASYAYDAITLTTTGNDSAISVTVPSGYTGVRVLRSVNLSGFNDGYDFTSTGTYYDDNNNGNGIAWSGSINSNSPTSASVPYDAFYVDGSATIVPATSRTGILIKAAGNGGDLTYAPLKIQSTTGVDLIQFSNPEPYSQLYGQMQLIGAFGYDYFGEIDFLNRDIAGTDKRAALIVGKKGADSTYGGVELGVLKAGSLVDGLEVLPDQSIRVWGSISNPTANLKLDDAVEITGAITNPTGILSVSDDISITGITTVSTITSSSNLNLTSTVTTYGLTLSSYSVLNSTYNTVLSTTANNYLWGNRPVAKSSASLPINITGFGNSQTGVTFTIFNISTAPITLVNASTFSLTENRIVTDTGKNIVLSSGNCRSLTYDNNIRKWTVVSGNNNDDWISISSASVSYLGISTRTITISTISGSFFNGSTATLNNVTISSAPVYVSSYTTVISTTMNTYGWGFRPICYTSATGLGNPLEIRGFSNANTGSSFTLIHASTQPIWLMHQSTTPLQFNRISLATSTTPVYLSSGSVAQFIYDGISRLWRQIK